jgi:hypothetical protein
MRKLNAIKYDKIGRGIQCPALHGSTLPDFSKGDET